MNGSIPCPCGQCLPCRINRRRLWTHRMVLEASKHAENSFLTLTYDQDHLPPDGSLVPRDTQLFMKRLRKAYQKPIRYYLVGEYGDFSWRPHYHAALFGIGPQEEELVKNCWGKGHIMLAEFNQHTAQYICGYVTKKMTAKDDPRLKGLHPEFARMSNRPGIGATAMEDVADALFSDAGYKYVMQHGDVPSALAHGGSLRPLGRYLKGKLRDAIGLPEEMRQRALKGYEAEVRAVFEDSQHNPAYTKEEKLTVKRLLVRQNLQKVRTLETRTKIFEKGKSL